MKVQTIEVESFKINSGICPDIVSGIFLPWKGNHYKPRQLNDFFLASIRN